LVDHYSFVIGEMSESLLNNYEVGHSLGDAMVLHYISRAIFIRLLGFWTSDNRSNLCSFDTRQR
jgi:hypothetical protein